MNPETPIMKKISKAASRRWHPVGLVYRINTGKGTPPGASHMIHFAPKGWPDDVLLLRGRLAGLEVKTKNGRPEESQLIMARSWWLAGVPYFFVRSPEEMFAAVEAHFPEEVWADPAPEEISRFREAMAEPKDPGAWLRAQGYL